MYKVIERFFDLTSEHTYEVGDSFPYEGKETKKRLTELSTSNNKIGRPVIVEVDKNASTNDS